MSLCEKKENRNIGTYLEQAVVAIINHEPIVNNTDYEFSTEVVEKINSDAQKIAETLGGTSASYIGNQTKNTNGDIIVDGKIVELKYVSCGKGTYLNTTMDYFYTELGFPSYREYMKEEILPWLSQFFGDKVYKNLSPVSKEESSIFQKTENYEILKQMDKKARAKYVADLYNLFVANPEKLAKFISDCITKKAAGKEAPDVLVIYDYSTNKITIIDKKHIQELVKNKTFTKTPLGLVFDGFRAQISWQNGTALNNPTIRVFIK
jgi:hypothetical protein